MKNLNHTLNKRITCVYIKSMNTLNYNFYPQYNMEIEFICQPTNINKFSVTLKKLRNPNFKNMIRTHAGRFLSLSVFKSHLCP